MGGLVFLGSVVDLVGLGFWVFEAGNFEKKNEKKNIKEKKKKKKKKINKIKIKK